MGDHLPIIINFVFITLTCNVEERCDKIKLSNLLLPRKRVAVSNAYDYEQLRPFHDPPVQTVEFKTQCFVLKVFRGIHETLLRPGTA